ncbi:uncharacterized protein LOC125763137 [Anopheles funestus]|uniref:uncharacterized protein LOC125763137 n=1 Tax=Anopheles funestus TaxID=62324 RepID=UPI0020C7441F|nr:uncharacterized protein LOC125763137 [Anopheles funestus]
MMVGDPYKYYMHVKHGNHQTYPACLDRLLFGVVIKNTGYAATAGPSQPGTADPPEQTQKEKKGKKVKGKKKGKPKKGKKGGTYRLTKLTNKKRNMNSKIVQQKKWCGVVHEEQQCAIIPHNDVQNIHR